MKDNIVRFRVNDDELRIINEVKEGNQDSISVFCKNLVLQKANSCATESPLAGEKSPEFDLKVISKELYEYWARLVPMLDEEDFLEKIMMVKGIGPDINNVHKVWKYILDRVNGVSDEQPVNHSDSQFSGWTFVGEVDTMEGIALQLQKESRSGGMQYEQVPYDHPEAEGILKAGKGNVI